MKTVTGTSAESFLPLLQALLGFPETQQLNLETHGGGAHNGAQLISAFKLCVLKKEPLTCGAKQKGKRVKRVQGVASAKKTEALASIYNPKIACNFYLALLQLHGC